MSQKFFVNDPNPQLADLDGDLTELFSALVTVANTANQISVTSATDGNGVTTLTWGLANSVSVPTLNATTQLMGKGTTANDSAPAGYIGEYTEVEVSSANAVAVGTGNTVNVANITLGPGDYDVTGVTWATGNVTAVIYVTGGVSESSGNLPSAGARSQWLGRSANLPVDQAIVLPTVRVQVAANTTKTVYHVAKASYAGGSLQVYGSMRVRRPR